MIKTQKLTPEVYYNHSRDFQLLGRLFDVVLNDVKTSQDTIYDIPSASSINSEELELLAYTLGFKSKHNYPINQLRAICGSLSEILKWKGSDKSIMYALNALISSQGISEEVTIEKDAEDINNLRIFIPKSLKDINLFKDLLDYILPAGITCEIINHSAIELGASTNVGSSDIFIDAYKKSYETSTVMPYGEQENELYNGVGRIDNAVAVPYDSEIDN